MTKPLVMPESFTLMNGSIRYGVSRNVPAEDANGKAVTLALVVIERDAGRAGTSFETIAIPESKIRFAGEGIIENEVRRAVGL